MHYFILYAAGSACRLYVHCCDLQNYPNVVTDKKLFDCDCVEVLFAVLLLCGFAFRTY